MGGLIKGAILGLVCALGLIGVMIAFGPEVDPAKLSESPQLTQNDAPNVATPQNTPEVEGQTSTDSQVSEPQTASQSPPQSSHQSPEQSPAQSAEQSQAQSSAHSPEDTHPDAAADQNDFAAVPSSPKSPEAEAAPQAPEATLSQPKVDLDSTSPTLKAQPNALDQSDVKTKSEPEVEISNPTSELPTGPAENDAQILTQESAPIETPIETAPNGEIAENDTDAPLDAPASAAPETVPTPPSTQSNAESEEGPPSGQFDSPDAPRALIKRNVDPATFGVKVGSFTDKNEGASSRANVRTGRLPSINTDNNESTEATEGAVEDSKPHALRDHSELFTTTGAPLISLMILESDNRGDDAARISILTEMGLAVSVAIDPTSEGASERAAAYRNIGAEIVLLADFPAGASPQDIEVTLGAYHSILPMAVALFEKPNSDPIARFNRDTLRHVVSLLNAKGLGLIAEQKGLNSSVQLANKAGVPNVQVFHRVTPDETQAHLRTIFNRAVFRAAQKGASVVVTPGDAQSLTALQAWALADRPSSVQIAPISAVLTGIAPQQ